jgi:Ca2+/Na+ antiporter
MRHTHLHSFVGYTYSKKTEYGMNEAEDIIWEHDEDLNVSLIFSRLLSLLIYIYIYCFSLITYIILINILINIFSRLNEILG